VPYFAFSHSLQESGYFHTGVVDTGAFVEVSRGWEEQTHFGGYKSLCLAVTLPPLVRGVSLILTFHFRLRKPNATLQPRPEAAATQERRLEAVRCKPLILIEAPSSTYHRGMLVGGKVLKKRRRPHALRHHATPI
jgi:hypothetical protein